MSHLLEIMTVEGYRVFFVQAQDSHRRPYFSAYVQIPDVDPMMGQIILDDRILPRLKDRIRQVMNVRKLAV